MRRLSLLVPTVIVPFVLTGCGDPRGAGAETPAELPDVAREATGHLDLTGAICPDEPVRGRIAGRPFTLKETELHEVTNVVLLHGAKGETIFIFLPGDTLPIGASVEMRTPTEGFDLPQVHVHFTSAGGGREAEIYMDGHAMTLSLGKRRGDVIPGQLMLRLPDQQQSALAGTFEILVDPKP